MSKPKIIRACTVPMSIKYFVEGMLPKLKEKYEVVLLSSPGPEMDAAVEKYGVKGIAVPMERHISLKSDLVALWRIARVLRRERPQMVHSMTPKAGLLCMMAAWLTRVPVRVHTFTGLVWPTASGMTRRILMATDWLTCACATHVIPEGEGVKNDLLSYGITRKPLQVLGYGNVRGIDLQMFSRRPEVMEKVTQIAQISQKGTFTFLFVGRIVGDKGINELVGAFQRLHTEHQKCRLILVGWYEKELDPVSEATQKVIDSHPHIHAVGTKEGDELLACYASADCFVMPSYREGFPNTVIEAGAMDLPCIVTGIIGSREIVVNENYNDNDNLDLNLDENGNGNGDECISVKKNGIVIPSRNEAALYAAMKRMMADDGMRKRMAGNARRMIAERFEQGYVKQCLLNFYDDILTYRR